MKVYSVYLRRLPVLARLCSTHVHLGEVFIMPSVVVTGVSSGIGWGTAKALVQHDFHVFGSVRKTEDADRLSAEWGEAFTPLFFDITDEQAVRNAAAAVNGHLHGSTL